MILLLGVVTAILSGIGWAKGWGDGVFVVIIAVGFANVPMFHFAMNWPLRDSEESDQAEVSADKER